MKDPFTQCIKRINAPDSQLHGQRALQIWSLTRKGFFVTTLIEHLAAAVNPASNNLFKIQSCIWQIRLLSAQKDECTSHSTPRPESRAYVVTDNKRVLLSRRYQNTSLHPSVQQVTNCSRIRAANGRSLYSVYRNLNAPHSQLQGQKAGKISSLTITIFCCHDPDGTPLRTLQTSR